MPLLLAIVFVISCATPYPQVKSMNFSDVVYPSPVKMAQVQGKLSVAYTDEGTGPETIIFIHGLGSSLASWQRNIAVLKEDYRCVALDLPGYGKSGKGVLPFSMEFYADVLANLIHYLGLEKAILAGHSMGGQISMVMALKYPEMVKSLVLIDPAGFETFNEGEKKWFRQVMTPELIKLTPVQQIRANVVSNFYDMPPEAEYMITDRIALRDAKDFDAYCYAVAQNVHAMVDQPVNHLLDKIVQPTLIVFGENDNLIPNPYLHPGKTKRIARIGDEKIPYSDLVMIPKCGHFAQFEKPEAVNKAIISFLNKN